MCLPVSAYFVDSSPVLKKIWKLLSSRCYMNIQLKPEQGTLWWNYLSFCPLLMPQMSTQRDATTKFNLWLGNKHFRATHWGWYLKEGLSYPLRINIPSASDELSKMIFAGPKNGAQWGRTTKKRKKFFFVETVGPIKMRIVSLDSGWKYAIKWNLN